MFAQFDEQGFPIAFYGEDFHGTRTIPIYGDTPEATEGNPNPERPIIGEKDNPDCSIPVDAINITHDQWQEFINNPGYRRWDGSKVIEYVPPTPEPQPVVKILPAVTLWERMTEDEAEQVAEVMATQPFRTRKIFETAATFRSDHELWPLLDQIANQLFGEERAAQLLA